MIVWVCPTKGCGNYYGASNAGDLDKIWNKDAKGEKTFRRSRCPDCFRRSGKTVDRVPIEFARSLP